MNRIRFDARLILPAMMMLVASCDSSIAPSAQADLEDTAMEAAPVGEDASAVPDEAMAADELESAADASEWEGSPGDPDEPWTPPD